MIPKGYGSYSIVIYCTDDFEWFFLCAGSPLKTCFITISQIWNCKHRKVDLLLAGQAVAHMETETEVV